MPDTLDAQIVDSFQFAGQDIPWLVAHWAKNKPDHPFLIWEPRSGSEQRWTLRAVRGGDHADCGGAGGRAACRWATRS